MEIVLIGGFPIAQDLVITSTAPFDLYEAERVTTILSITCSEITGAGTPMLTVEKYDVAKTTSYILRKRAMTAGETFVYDEPFRLERGWKIRVIASVANQVAAYISYFDPLLTYHPPRHASYDR